MTLRRLAVVAVFALSAAAGACSDPFAATASTANFLDTLTAFAITGTPQVLPTAFDVPNRIVVRATGDFTYDIVFDLDAQNQVLLYPVALIGGPFATGRTVGIQKYSGTFDQATKAPTGGYVFDSITVVKPGDVVYIQVANSTICQFAISQFMFTKMVIDSVTLVDRAIHFRSLNDPNCGFRNLTPGTPKN